MGMGRHIADQILASRSYHLSRSWVYGRLDALNGIGQVDATGDP